MNTSQPSPSPDEQLMGVLLGMIQGRCLTAAVELGLADVLANGPLPVDQIAEKTNSHPGSLCRLIRALEPMGVFRQSSPRVFENTPLS